MMAPNPQAQSREQYDADRKLEDKLAAIVFHLQETRANRMDRNQAALNSYLDDADVQNWITKMDRDGRLNNLRYTRFGSKKD